VISPQQFLVAWDRAQLFALFKYLVKPQAKMAQDLLADVESVSRIEAVPTILEVVCRTTGMRFAAVTRVTEERWIACSVLDEIDFGLGPGGELKVETTICHEIRQSRGSGACCKLTH
jgi:hypothetical protein